MLTDTFAVFHGRCLTLPSVWTLHNHDAFLNPRGSKESVNARRSVSTSTRLAADPRESHWLRFGAVCGLPDRTWTPTRYDLSVCFRRRAFWALARPAKDQPRCRGALSPATLAGVPLQDASASKGAQHHRHVFAGYLARNWAFRGSKRSLSRSLEAACRSGATSLPFTPADMRQMCCRTRTIGTRLVPPRSVGPLARLET